MFKNMGQMMKQAQQMQAQLTAMQAELEKTETQGTSGGGLVKVTVTGQGHLKHVAIDPSLCDPAEVEVLEDLIVAAFNDARQKADAVAAEKMGALTGGMNLPAGMKLPF